MDEEVLVEAGFHETTSGSVQGKGHFKKSGPAPKNKCLSEDVAKISNHV